MSTSTIKQSTRTHALLIIIGVLIMALGFITYETGITPPAVSNVLMSLGASVACFCFAALVR